MALGIPNKADRRDLHINLYDEVLDILDDLRILQHCSRSDIITALLTTYGRQELAELRAQRKKGTK